MPWFDGRLCLAPEHECPVASSGAVGPSALSQAARARAPAPFGWFRNLVLVARRALLLWKSKCALFRVRNALPFPVRLAAGVRVPHC
jgi:hypothetical protein